MTSSNDDTDIVLLNQSNVPMSSSGVEDPNNEFSMHNGDPQNLKLAFDLSSLDPSDPLNFLMPNAGVNENSGPGSVSGDSSSMEDTNSSASSNHGSPGAWPAVWNGNEEDSINLGYPQFSGTPPEVNEQPKWPTDSATQAMFDDLNVNNGGGNLGMDIDFDPSSLSFSFGNENSDLNFDPSIFAQVLSSMDFSQLNTVPEGTEQQQEHPAPLFSGQTNNILTADFIQSLQSQLQNSLPQTEVSSHLEPPSEASSSRRLSVTSAPSSAPSLSPIAETQSPSFVQQRIDLATGPKKAPVQLAPQQPSDVQALASVSAAINVYEELAQKVRQLAGVMMALPYTPENVRMAYAQQQQQQPQGNGKLPIPRLTRVTPPQPSKRKASGASTSASSSPTATTPPTPLEAGAQSPASSSYTTGSSPPAEQKPGSNTDTSAVSTQSIAPGGRPKTSHTTIERRYRTNLNARIQSLRAAVPALRVLEQKDGNRVGNLAFKAGTKRVANAYSGESAGDEIDVVDERGFVDGVKVARKGSKANVLGKAVEYIRVLKKREYRLKREQEGLKSLLSGLVGGPLLLSEWEREWRDRFGGPEADEVEGEEGEDYDEEGDEDGEDDDVEEGAGKKRKRSKADGPAKAKKETARKAPGPSTASTSPSPPAAPVIASDLSMNTIFAASSTPIFPEKRKRGRPRKAPLPTTVPSQAQPQATMKMEIPEEDVMQQAQLIAQALVAQQQPAHQPGAGQYLLAAFAFFSFFSSPLSFASHRYHHRTYEHGHVGSVLGGNDSQIGHTNPSSPPSAVDMSGSILEHGFDWRDAVQLIHFIVSVLLFCSIVAPWVPRAARARIARFVPSSLKPIFGLEASSPSTSPHSKRDDDVAVSIKSDEVAYKAALRSALSRSPPTSSQAMTLRVVLGAEPGMWGMMSSVIRTFVGQGSKERNASGQVKSDRLERQGLEQRAWMRVAELSALNVNTPMSSRLQVYLCSHKYISPFQASVSDLATLALLVHPFWSSKSEALWSLAREKLSDRYVAGGRVCETYARFVLEGLTVREAVDRVKGAATSSGKYGRMPKRDDDVLRFLARGLIQECIRQHSEVAFAEVVLAESLPMPMNAAAQTSAYPHPLTLTPAERDSQLHRIVDAGKSLDEETATLASIIQRVCSPTHSHLLGAGIVEEIEELSQKMAEDEDEDEDEGYRSSPSAEICTLLTSIALYRQIFPSTLMHLPSSGALSAGSHTSLACSSFDICLEPTLSPPPSPPLSSTSSPTSSGAKLNPHVMLHMHLRRAMDSPVFDKSEILDEARGCVVDMLTSSVDQEEPMWAQRHMFD